MEYEVAPVKYPMMRNQIKSNLESLASPEFQKNIWIERANPLIQECFSDIIGFLFDSMGLIEQVDKNNLDSIGIIFWNEEEAIAISNLVRILDQVLDDPNLGQNPTDEDYIFSALWPKVLGCAKLALNLFNKNDEPYKRLKQSN